MTDDREARRSGLPRRNFLTCATIGAGIVAAGATVQALGRSLAPTAAVHAAQNGFRFRFADLDPGTPVSFLFRNRPIRVLKLDDTQLLAARAGADLTTPDPWARNENLVRDARATLENRSFEAAGSFVVLDARCPRFGCITMFGAGDYGAWFCPCYGAHFDILGRLLRGPSPRNMTVPACRVVDGTDLVFTDGPRRIDDETLDRLLYGGRAES